MQTKTADEARNYPNIIVILILCLTGISLLVTLGHSGKASRDLAKVMGRSFFESIVAARKWNAAHGGVYVVMADGLEPNRYLEDPLRDITATNGLKLTKVNPAHMTRLISEYLDQKGGIRVHITSLNPLNPGNRADPWEEAALSRFDEGDKEAHAIEKDAESRLFRYMAPLIVEGECVVGAGPDHPDPSFLPYLGSGYHLFPGQKAYQGY
jgi:hypothetical protein